MYTFTVQTTVTVKSNLIFEYLLNSTSFSLPLPDEAFQSSREIMLEFINKTKRFFASPLNIDSVMKRLRHGIYPDQYPPREGKYSYVMTPCNINVQREAFTIIWSVKEWIPDDTIPASFLGSMTPRAPTPEQEIRKIQIHETIPTNETGLVQVTDLPLSDLPPLSFETEAEVPTRRETEKQRIREARLRVALAKLKAERMTQKFFMKYGETPEEDSDSDLSSDSDGEEDYAQ